MGRWTPLILMGGGLAILLGTLLGINFPMGGQQQTASNNAPTGKREKVLPANINVNSTAPSTGSRATQEETVTTPQETRRSRSVAQENLSPTTTERRTSVAQNTTPDDSSSFSDNTTETTTTEVQSTETQSTDTSSDNESTRVPIRALW